MVVSHGLLVTRRQVTAAREWYDCHCWRVRTGSKASACPRSCLQKIGECAATLAGRLGRPRPPRNDLAHRPADPQDARPLTVARGGSATVPGSGAEVPFPEPSRQAITRAA